MLCTGETANIFAENRNVPRSTMHRVLANVLQTKSIRDMISEAIGLKIEQIWYDIPVEDKPLPPPPVNNFNLGSATIVSRN